MANENFDFQSSEMPKSEEFPGGVLVNTFTMVEEKLWIREL